MNIWQITILAITQGLAELLPVSSSAHVIVLEKLMGLDPAAPEMTFLLVMLHTGTMFAVIVTFWSRWRALLMSNRLTSVIRQVIIATLFTGVIGYGLKIIIEKLFLPGGDKAEIEQLFGNLHLISLSLAAAGVLILVSGLKRWKKTPHETKQAVGVGLIQGLCLPFRGFSRSGATISTGLILGQDKTYAEDFSFILAVVLTPPVLARELLRLAKERATVSPPVLPGVLGMVFSFIAGVLAIRWLSRWLEGGKWHYFGIYCLILASAIWVYSNFTTPVFN